jgi:cytochrome P450
MPDHTATLPDPFAADVHQDPYPAYQQLRESGAVHLGSIGVPTYYRHADCSAILRDRRWGCGFNEERLEWVQRLGVSQVFLHQNPPEHTKLRRLTSQAFTPAFVAAMRTHITEACDQLFDSALAGGEADLIPSYAYPLPITVISEMLGAPPEAHELFYAWSRALGRGLEPSFTQTAEIMAGVEKSTLEFNAYFGGLAQQRRGCPADDLITRLTQVQQDGGLSEADLRATCVLLIVAGHETTANLIGNGILALLRNPEQLAMVREAPPEIADTWVDELLRYDAPVQFLKRTALEDLDYGGRMYKRGDTVAVVIGSGNRDATVFTDPEVLDLARPDNHMSFGLGIHFCLGASLARLETAAAISTLLRRAPDLCLAEDNPPFRENLVIRGLERLPVRFGKRSH